MELLLNVVLLLSDRRSSENFPMRPWCKEARQLHFCGFPPWSFCFHLHTSDFCPDKNLFLQIVLLELKLRYCPVMVGLWYTDVLNPFFVRVITTFRNVSWLLFYPSNVDWRLLNSDWPSVFVQVPGAAIVWWYPPISHSVGFSGAIPKVMSSKYSMYMRATTDEEAELIAKPSFV